MSKKFIIGCFCVFISFSTLYAQETIEPIKPTLLHSVYADILGHSFLYGVGYDCRFYKQNTANSLGIGVGIAPGVGDQSGFYVPLRAYYCISKKYASLETGLVVRYQSLGSTSFVTRTVTVERGVSMMPYIGYRYQRCTQGGIFFRAYISPFIYQFATLYTSNLSDRTISSFDFNKPIGGLGVSLGYTFPPKLKK